MLGQPSSQSLLSLISPFQTPSRPLEAILAHPPAPLFGISSLFPPYGTHVDVDAVEQQYKDAIASLSERLGTDKWFLGSSCVLPLLNLPRPLTTPCPVGHPPRSTRSFSRISTASCTPASTHCASRSPGASTSSPGSGVCRARSGARSARARAPPHRSLVSYFRTQCNTPHISTPAHYTSLLCIKQREQYAYCANLALSQPLCLRTPLSLRLTTSHPPARC